MAGLLDQMRASERAQQGGLLTHRPFTPVTGRQIADGLQAAGLLASPIPVLGDVAGLVGDAAMYAAKPEERTWGNAALTALGVLPFVPAMAGKVGKALDMTTAARMKRAADMGFDTPAFHATGADFREFVPNQYRGASFMAATPDGAMRGARAGAADVTGTGATSIMPLMVRSEDIEGLRMSPTERAWWKKLPDKLAEAQVEAAVKGRPAGSSWHNFYDEIELPDGTFQYVKKPEPATTFADVQRTGRDLFGRSVSHYSSLGGEGWSSSEVLKRGQKGFLQADEGGVSIGMADPSGIRSKFAAFDPSKAGSKDILASLAAAGLLSPAFIASMRDEQRQ